MVVVAVIVAVADVVVAVVMVVVVFPKPPLEGDYLGYSAKS